MRIFLIALSVSLLTAFTWGPSYQHTFSVGASQLVLAANTFRSYLAIQNHDGTTAAYLKFGSAITTTEGIRIAPNGSFITENPPSGALYMKAAAGSITISVIEGVK